MANRSSQSKRDFIPKRNFIGRKFCETDKKGFFAKKYFFEDEEKLPKRLPKRIEEKGGFLSDKNEKSLRSLSTVLSLAVSRALSSLCLYLLSTEWIRLR